MGLITAALCSALVIPKHWRSTVRTSNSIHSMRNGDMVRDTSSEGEMRSVRYVGGVPGNQVRSGSVLTLKSLLWVL